MKTNFGIEINPEVCEQWLQIAEDIGGISFLSIHDARTEEPLIHIELSVAYAPRFRATVNYPLDDFETLTSEEIRYNLQMVKLNLMNSQLKP